MKKNGNAVIELIVVLVIVIFALYSMSKNSSTVTNTPDTVSTEDTSTGSVNTVAPAKAITYEQALIKYADARIQLSEDCQAHPNIITRKNNTEIMIDNRASVARSIKMNSKTYSIKAYGFKVIKLSSSTLPATWFMDCGTSKNVATVLIQK
jgi:hypothetical protein